MPTFSLKGTTGSGSKSPPTFAAKSEVGGSVASGEASKAKIPSLKVLFIDDCSLVRLLANGALSQLGQKVTMSEDTEEALAVIERGEVFDLIVTDENLGPDKRKGSEFVKLLRSRRINTTCILSPAYSKSEAE